MVAGTSVKIYGTCTDLYTHGPAEDVLVKILIQGNGSIRTYWVYTSLGTGEFMMNFQPSYNEGG